LYRQGYAATPLSDFFLSGPLRAGMRVLDLGCGDGSHLRYLGDRFGVHGVGIDFARTALLRERQGNGPRPRVQGRIQELPFRREAFDAVYSFGVIEHTWQTEEIIRASFELLRPGGWAYHSVPHLFSLWTFLRPLKRLVGKWKIGLERSFSVPGLHRVFRRAGFDRIEYRLYGYDSFDCYTGSRWVVPVYALEDYLLHRWNMFGFFLHVRGFKGL
jgi:SAM-dependent methyltransferase